MTSLTTIPPSILSSCPPPDGEKSGVRDTVSASTTDVDIADADAARSSQHEEVSLK